MTICRALPPAAALLLLSARAALALDMEFYTYNGFGPVSQAFQRLGLIFSDSDYLGLFFTVTVLGVFCAALAFYVRSITTMKIVPLAWAWPVLLGVSLYLGAFVPKGNVTVYDPVLNRMRIFPNIPDAIVLITGVQNKIERALIEIVDTAGAPGAKYQETAGGIGFSVLHQALNAPMRNAYAEMSMAAYIEDCVVYELSLPDSRILPEDLLYGTTDFLAELALATRPTIFTTYYDAAHPGGESLTCTEAWNDLQAIYGNSANFSGAVLAACGASLFDPSEASEVAQCRALVGSTLTRVTGSAVSPEKFVSQGNISRLLYTVLDQADLQTAMAVKANQRIATNAFGIGTTLNEWLPIIRALLIAISIALVPLLVIFLPTPLFSRALLAMFGFFFLTTTWGVCDAFLHQAAMDYAVEAFEEIRQSGLGLHACLNFPEVSTKILAMFGMFRSSGLMLAGFLSMMLFRFGGHALVAMAGNLQGAVQGAGGEAGRMAAPEGAAMAREGLINAAAADGWLNTNSFGAMTAGKELARQSGTAQAAGFERQYAAAGSAGLVGPGTSAQEYLRQTHAGGSFHNEQGAHSVSAGTLGEIGLAQTRSAGGGFSSSEVQGGDGRGFVSHRGGAGSIEGTRGEEGKFDLNRADAANLNGVTFSRQLRDGLSERAAHSLGTSERFSQMVNSAREHSDSSSEARDFTRVLKNSMNETLGQRVAEGSAFRNVQNETVRDMLQGTVSATVGAKGGFDLFGNGFSASASGDGRYIFTGVAENGNSFSMTTSAEDTRAINQSMEEVKTEALGRTLRNTDARKWAQSSAQEQGANEAFSYLKELDRQESDGAAYAINAETDFIRNMAMSDYGAVNEETLRFSLNRINQMQQTPAGQEMLADRLNGYLEARFKADSEMDAAKARAEAGLNGSKSGNLPGEVQEKTAGADFAVPGHGDLVRPSPDIGKKEAENSIGERRDGLKHSQEIFNEAIGLGGFNRLSTDDLKKMASERIDIDMPRLESAGPDAADRLARQEAERDSLSGSIMSGSGSASELSSSAREIRETYDPGKGHSGSSIPKEGEDGDKPLPR